MADFSIPLATGIYSSIDPLIAKAGGTDLSWIGNLPDSYWAGQNQQFLQRNRNLFQNGIPPDMATALLKAGGAAAIPEYVSLKKLELGQQDTGPIPGEYGYGGQSSPTTRIVSPSSADSVSSAPSGGGVVRSTPTVMGDREGVERGYYEAPTTPGARPPLQPVDTFAQRFGATQPSSAPPSGAMAGARPVQTMPIQQPSPPRQSPDDQKLQAEADRQQQISDIASQRARKQASLGNDAESKALLARAAEASQQANEIRKSLLQRAPGALDYAGAVEEQKKQIASLDVLANKGIEANGKLAQLNAVQQLGENVGYGAVPKLQSFLGRYGVDTKGLSDIQAYERAVDNLAPQLRPIGSGRLLQNELNAFKSALGGLMTTPEGRRISIENLKLINTYSEQVGAIAVDTSLSPSQRYQKIYGLDPPKLRLEVTKTSPGPAGSPGTAQATPQFKEGDTATNPKTGAKAVFTNGKWMQGL